MPSLSDNTLAGFSGSPWDRSARLKSARACLAKTQCGRPLASIAKSYRRRYGVDSAAAIAELTDLGIAFDPVWLGQIAHQKTTAAAKPRRRNHRHRVAESGAVFDSDATFALIVDYTEGGAPFGTTWEEHRAIEQAPATQAKATAAPTPRPPPPVRNPPPRPAPPPPPPQPASNSGFPF